MEKFLEWIRKNKKLFIFFIIIIALLPIVSIHFLFKLKTNIYWLQAEWGPGDLLGYFGDLLSFLGTVSLGIIAIYQTEKANSLSNKLVELELDRRTPYFDIVQNQSYKIGFGEDIDHILKKYDRKNDMLLQPCYIQQKRTGIITSIAAMKIKVQNLGNSAIRNIFIRSFHGTLSVDAPDKYINCVAHYITGNTFINPGERKNLFIEFQEELDENFDTLEPQISWAKDNTHMLPSFDFELTIITVEGNSYKENISCGTSLSVIQKNNAIIRNLGTLNICIERE